MARFLSIIASTLLLFGLEANRVLAQDNFGINDFASGGVNLGTRPLRETIAGIVNIGLGFLGILAVLLILYGGYIWMTSQGNSEKVQRAKMIIISAIIGLVIILTAYAVSRFILTSLYNNTVPVGSGTEEPPIPPDLDDCPEPDDPNTPIICSISRISGPAGVDLKIYGYHFDTNTSDDIIGEVTIGGQVAEVVECGGDPMWEATWVKVKVPGTLGEGLYGLTLSNDLEIPSIENPHFNFNVIPGTTGPIIDCLRPDTSAAGALPMPVVVEGSGFGTAAGNVSMLGVSGGSNVTLNNTDLNVDTATWSETNINFTVPVNALASYVTVEVGGISDKEFFYVTCNETEASSCSASSNCCSSSMCLESSVCAAGSSRVPHIDYISPDNGTAGNLITIFGSNFGANEANGGVVTFDLAGGGTIIGQNPSGINPACGDTWTNDYIIMAIPGGVATTGQVTITQDPIDGGQTSDNSVAFSENGIVRPGICSLSSPSGSYGDDITVNGLNFTANPVPDRAFFGNTPSYDTSVSNTILAQAEVPNVIGQLGMMMETADNEESNLVPFAALSVSSDRPVINSISGVNDEARGPVGQYITIMGANFGTSQGRVVFDSNGVNQDGDFDFPSVCTTNFWRDDRIIVKVPANADWILNNAYPVMVIRNTDGAQSVDYNFQITSGRPGPQICDMEPDNGAPGTLVNFYGENFGNGGQVIFYENQAIVNTPTFWTDNEIIGAAVPNDATTGLAHVEDSEGNPSNGIPFSVGSCADTAYCIDTYGEGNLCCPSNAGNVCSLGSTCETGNSCSYTWRITTETDKLAVENVWPDCNGACTNSLVEVEFNHEINWGTVGVVAADFNIVNSSGNDIASGIITQVSPVRLRIEYTGDLERNQTYTVTVPNTFTDTPYGYTLDEPYIWTFETGSDHCIISGAEVTPNSWTSEATNDVTPFTISAMADSPSCGLAPVYCANCTYDWSLSNPTVASIPAPSLNQTVQVTTILPSGENSTRVSGTITDNSVSPAPSFSSYGILNVDIAEVVPSNLTATIRPDCAILCTNALIEVSFNNDLDPTTVTSLNFMMYDNLDPAHNIVTDLTLSGDRIVTMEHEDFQSGHSYVVSLSENIMDMGTNHLVGGDTFPFAVGGEECEITGVEVLPADFVAEAASQDIGYRAQPMSNSVSCGPIPVYCDNCSYDWSSTVLATADISSVNAIGDEAVVTTGPLVATGDNTRIYATVDDNGTSFTNYGDLSINLDTTPPISYATPFIVSYEPLGTGICTNIAPSIQFSEIMNTDSVKNNVKLYEACTTDPSGWCEVAGKFSFSAIDYNDDGHKGTKAVFYSNDLLTTNTIHWVVLTNPTLIISSHNIQLNTGVLPTAPVGGVGWEFTTTDHICQIHHTIISPDPDLFTCALRNDCEGDVPAAGAGNQHEYTAYVYDIRGNELNGNFMTFAWSVDNALLTLTASPNLGSTYATASNTNGTSVMSVRVASTEDNSSASDTSKVDLFLCQNPWPNVTDFPWRENTFNFSTYYCQDTGLPNSVSLPFLIYPPVANAPAPTGVMTEYIFTIMSLASADSDLNQHLGSLAFNSSQSSDIVSKEPSVWWRKVSALFGINEAKSQVPLCAPAAPTNLAVTSVDETHISLSWQRADRYATEFIIERRQTGVELNFSEIVTLPGTTTSYNDTDVVPGGAYEYRVWSYSSTCDSGYTSVYSSNTISVTATSNEASVDIIAIRVMPNRQHLSISDWFKKFAPNPNENGTLTQVDGYEALQVGATTYIAATNIDPTLTPARIYTNVYIIAHNIGAGVKTVDIYNQLISNFSLNINIIPDNNVCNGDVSISCTNDYDCPGDDWCQSQGLKLRRDTKRLGDLVNVMSKIEDYGQAHKACRNNSLIACTRDTDCPGTGIGRCQPSYPSLTAGSFIPGMSNSTWPSWSNPLSTVLGSPLPTDPINKFNGCDADADPNTCWDATNLDFTCPLNSSIYLYRSTDSNRSYYLGANFEYDLQAQFGVTFANNLYPDGGVEDIIYPDYGLTTSPLSADLGAYCQASSISGQGIGGVARCGNGIIDSNYCSDPLYTTQTSCLTNGARWVAIEECDIASFNDNICSDTLGDYNWWNNQSIGCNLPGTIDAAGALIECTWYDPEPPLTVQECGGYCGDTIIQPFYEGCEGTRFDGTYTCANTLIRPTCGPGCQPICTDGGTTYPAASCNDGIWTEGVEQCDSTANPNGLSGWDCSSGGNISCDSSCHRVCSAGTAYDGACGNGILESPEQCDYLGYVAPPPANSSVSNSYGCNINCTFDTQYCGNSILETQYQEVCEATLYQAPETSRSNRFAQYSCRMSGIYTYNGYDYGACTATQGGWCGDGALQAGATEQCDPGNPWSTPAIAPSYSQPLPPDSSISNQYACRSDCHGSTGGYCGDGDAQTQYGEICDGTDYPTRPSPVDSGPQDTYVCLTSGPYACVSNDPTGGYCGDGNIDTLFGETCDVATWGDPYYPWPRTRTTEALTQFFSSDARQYECNSCINSGGYCGDGIIQSYEDCDTGFDPAIEIEKNVDLVYVFDMSGSMVGDATTLCTATQAVADDLDTNHPEIDYRITIYVLGDSDGTASITPTTADDIVSLFSGFSIDDGTGVTWGEHAQEVFSALYTNCRLHTNSGDYPHVRYLSFYDNDTNEIAGGVSINGDSAYGESCNDSDGINDADQFAGRLENWGYGIDEIVNNYRWRNDYHRVIIPVSDEAAYCGGNATIYGNENYDGSATLPDVLTAAVSSANSSDPKVHISPVLRRWSPLFPIGQALADDTGGLFTSDVSGWAAHVINVINSTFCDGNGDKFMDCTMPE